MREALRSALRPIRRGARAVRRWLRRQQSLARRGHWRRILRRATGLATPGDYRRRDRALLWPGAPLLDERHVRNCRVFPFRERLLEHLPTGGVCAEVGVLHGDFARAILSTTKPAKLHLIELRRPLVDRLAERFRAEIAAGVVELHCGHSADSLLAFPESYFDWVYLDADHRYDPVRRDLAAARLRVKPEGSIVLNDYVSFSVLDFNKYGVVEAVNEFCLEHDWEIYLFALQSYMNADVALRRIAPSGEAPA